jgi:hypothetical protein
MAGFDPRLAAKDPDLETILSLRKQRSEDGATSYQLTLTGSRSNSFTSSPTTPATGDSAAQIFERSGDEPSEGVSPDGSATAVHTDDHPASLYSTLGVAPDVLSVHSRTLAVAAHGARNRPAAKLRVATSSRRVVSGTLVLTQASERDIHHAYRRLILRSMQAGDTSDVPTALPPRPPFPLASALASHLPCATLPPPPPPLLPIPSVLRTINA